MDVKRKNLSRNRSTASVYTEINDINNKKGVGKTPAKQQIKRGQSKMTKRQREQRKERGRSGTESCMISESAT